MAIMLQSGSRKVRGLLLFVTLSFLTGQLPAQSVIQGSVIDRNEQPFGNANVLLLKARDSSLVKGILTSSNGRYSFENIAPGTYLLSSSYTGLQPAYTTVVTVDGKNIINIPPLKLSEHEKVLSSVQVIARKPLFEQKIDRMVINVASSITSAGSTVLDVLERSPGVVVDRQNNLLVLNGKDGVMVMINGKINRMPIASLMQMLASMSSDNIERIELITTPPANFDAEGNAGYINIVLKSNPNMGTNGSFSITGGWGNKEIAEGSGNFNHRRKGFNLYGDYNFSRFHLMQDFQFYHAVRNGSRLLENYSFSNRDPVERVHAPTLGIDIDLSKNTIIGVLATFYHRKWTMDAQNTGQVFSDHNLDTIIRINNYELHTLKSYTANLNLQHQFNEKEKLTINFDYMYYRDHNPVRYSNEFFNGQNVFINSEQVLSEKLTPIKFWIGNADYTKRLNKRIEMEAGIKSTVSRFTNDVLIQRLHSGSWSKDLELSNLYHLKEDITAAFTSLNITASEKTSVKAGLRFEYTNSNLGSATKKDIVDRHYGSWFPGFFLSHTLNTNNSANFSYTRRITRPTFWNLAPFVIFIDPNTYFSGNPGLQPSITDALSLAYTYKRKTFSLSYSFENTPITNFAPRVDPATNKETLAAENQDNRVTWAINASLPVSINTWWSVQMNIGGLIQNLDGYYNKERIRIAQKTFRLNATQNFKLPKEYTVSLNGFYNSASLFGIYKNKGFGSLDAGVQKKISTRSILRFNAANLLNTLKYEIDVNLPEKNLVANGLLVFRRQSFRLTWTHSFGSDKVKDKRSRKTGSEEEKSRLQN
jgi:hypothetical protein